MAAETLPYRCCFCQRPGTVCYDTPGADISRLLDVLPKKIACDDCALFERVRRDCVRSLAMLASRWEVLPQSARSSEIEAELRDKLTARFQRLCNAYCERLKITGLFDEMMVHAVVRHPQALSDLLRTIDKTAHDVSTK